MRVQRPNQNVLEREACHQPGSSEVEEKGAHLPEGDALAHPTF